MASVIEYVLGIFWAGYETLRNAPLPVLLGLAIWTLLINGFSVGFVIPNRYSKVLTCRAAIYPRTFPRSDTTSTLSFRENVHNIHTVWEGIETKEVTMLA